MVTSLLFKLFINLWEIHTFVFKAIYRTFSYNCLQFYRVPQTDIILAMERKLWPQIVSRDFSYPAGIYERNRFILLPIM